MLPLSKRTYTVILMLLIGFLLISAGTYFGLLVWMSINHIEATGTAFQKLELFIAGNFGLLMGSIFKPNER